MNKLTTLFFCILIFASCSENSDKKNNPKPQKKSDPIQTNPKETEPQETEVKPRELKFIELFRLKRTYEYDEAFQVHYGRDPEITIESVDKDSNFIFLNNEFRAEDHFKKHIEKYNFKGVIFGAFEYSESQIEMTLNAMNQWLIPFFTFYEFNHHKNYKIYTITDEVKSYELALYPETVLTPITTNFFSESFADSILDYNAKSGNEFVIIQEQYDQQNSYIVPLSRRKRNNFYKVNGRCVFVKEDYGYVLSEGRGLEVYSFNHSLTEKLIVNTEGVLKSTAFEGNRLFMAIQDEDYYKIGYSIIE